jgi:hypothetical protein
MSFKVPLKDGIAQSDFDLANFKPKNANLSDYAGSNINWNSSTKKFDATGGGGGGGFPMVNVKDSPYDAAGDGVTDDTVAINTAIFDVMAAGGGIVFFPHGIYLCNGAFTAYNDILHIQTVGATTASAVSIMLLGETPPPWSVAFAFDESRNSTIKTTKSGVGVTHAALLAGNIAHEPGLLPYDQMSNVRLTIKNMSFLVPDNPSLHGLRLESIGWVTLEDCRVFAGNGQVEPTNGTVGIWMPASINFGLSWANRVWASGWDTGFRAGELFRSPWTIAYYCKTGYELTQGSGPSIGCLGPAWCATGVKFTGTHYCDFTFLTEHAAGTAPAWQQAVHDISDPSNLGTGLIKYFIANGNSGANIVASLDGGAGLTVQSLFSGDIILNTIQGAGGAATGGKITGRGAVPPGGTSGFSLKKNSNSDYDLVWGPGAAIGQATGWTSPTGTDRRGGYATSTATLTQVAESLKSLIADLTTLGLLGP